MNDRLKVAVERIVRPVEAPGSTKLQMREELYAHLLAIQAEEAVQGGTEDEILRRSIERLGPPDQLTPDLQRSLSWHERHETRMNRWLGRRPADTPLTLATRISLSMFILVGVAFTVALTGRALAGTMRPMPYGAALGLVALFTIDSFVLTVLAAWCGERVDPPTLPVWRQKRAWLAALTGGVCVSLVGLGVMAIACGGWDIPLSARRHWALLGSVTVVGFLSTLSLYQLERRRLSEWETLELSAEPGVSATTEPA